MNNSSDLVIYFRRVFIVLYTLIQSSFKFLTVLVKRSKMFCDSYLFLIWRLY